MLQSFGSGMFNYPHGLAVDHEGNVYVTDGRDGGGKGHTVLKFNPAGELVLTLGQPGVAGEGRNTLNRPSDVAIARNGDIFVADGHSGMDTNMRIVKYSKDGTFIKEWGKKGSAPGELNGAHGLAFDSRGRLFVADLSEGIRIGSARDGSLSAHMAAPVPESGRAARVAESVAVDAQGNLYAGENAGMKLLKFAARR